MKTQEWHFTDKAGWNAGPWVNEPDKRQWLDEPSGLPCLIVRGPHGGLCGYVGVSTDHPFHGLSYSATASIDKIVAGKLLNDRGVFDLYESDLIAGELRIEAIISCHGGLTYADGCQHSEHGICHVVDPGEPDDTWWFGFDCAHAGDFSPAYEGLYSAASLGMPTGWGGVVEYRNVDYVTAECQSLASQLSMIKDQL